MLEYISTEENEYLYVGGVSADTLSMDQLVDVYRKCIKSINDKSKDSMREFIIEMLSIIGESKYLYHCDQCGDDVYDHILKTDHHEVVYTEGCTCYGLTFDGLDYDYDNDKISQCDVIEFLGEVPSHFNGNSDNIIDILMEFVRIFGTFDEKWYNDYNDEHTYNEKFVLNI